MRNSLFSFLQNEAVTVAPFELSRQSDFPYTVYTSNLVRYQEYENWFDGSALDQQVMQDGKKVELYPVRINPLSGAALKHSYALFGEFDDDGRPLVIPRFIPPRNNDQMRDMALSAEEALNLLWWENNSRALMMENGLNSQIYGGCVFKVTYVPWEGTEMGGWRQVPIRMEVINPKSFVGIPDASDFWRLREAWIVRYIGAGEARELGVDVSDDDPPPIMMDYWSRERYEVTINGQLASKPIPRSGERFPLGGVNPYGVVPIVYIPHVRQNGFYGLSLFNNLQGLVREINMRMADFGDAVSDDAHNVLAMRNVHGTPQVVRLTHGVNAVNLGGNPGITGQESQPDLFEVSKARASEPMHKLTENLYKQFRRDALIPAVADGEDEGSQRSALTLSVRMWPLTSHIMQERVYWGTGLDLLTNIALRIMAAKKILGITEQHLELRTKQVWYPILPRDREALITELVQRMSVNLGSPELLLELAGDVENIDEEMERIKNWLDTVAKAQAAARPEPSGQDKNQVVQSARKEA